MAARHIIQKVIAKRNNKWQAKARTVIRRRPLLLCNQHMYDRNLTCSIIKFPKRVDNEYTIRRYDCWFLVNHKSSARLCNNFYSINFLFRPICFHFSFTNTYHSRVSNIIFITFRWHSFYRYLYHEVLRRCTCDIFYSFFISLLPQCPFY